MNELSIKKTEIDNFLQKAISKANPSKAARLNTFNRLCEQFVSKSVPLKITLLVKYMVENGHQMSQQSIYNKQSGGNPYRNLFDLWSEYDTLKRASSKPVIKTKQTADEFIDEADLKLIEDPVLRYRVSLMYGELKGLKKQNDLLKQAKEMSIIHSTPEYLIEAKDSVDVLLNDYEIHIIKELLNTHASMSFNEDGALIAKLPIRMGQTLSNQGLKDALLKILSSYNAK